MLRLHPAAMGSAPKIPEAESLVKGVDFEAWLEHWPAGPIVIVRSRCFHVGLCFLDRQRALELQRVLIPIIKALE